MSPWDEGIAPPGSSIESASALPPRPDPTGFMQTGQSPRCHFWTKRTCTTRSTSRCPLGDAANVAARAAELPFMKCPTDPANSVDNHFQRSGLSATDVGYARGNYAINGGTSRRCLTRLSTRKINCTDGVHVDGTDLRNRHLAGLGQWGHRRQSVDAGAAEFSCGMSKLVLVEEIRAGVHPLDRRGVWSLGFAGSSVTACHGLYGNNGPNRGKDVIQGCNQLSAQVADLEFRECHAFDR